VIAIGTPDALIQQNFNETVIEFGLTGGHSLDGIFNTLPGVTRPGMVQDHHVTLYTNNVTATLMTLMEQTRQSDFHFDALNVRTATLEDVFLKLTGKPIRE
jgi:ABC-2 type transport system ATP-binding protein